MKNELSANTQAILLLTAPLIAGRSEEPAGLLTLGEYKKLARHQELLKLLGLNEEEKEASDPDELLQRFIESDFDPKEFDSRYKED